MAPLAEKYKEKTQLREIECSKCNAMIASRMKIPRCFKCGTYNKQ